MNNFSQAVSICLSRLRNTITPYGYLSFTASNPNFENGKTSDAVFNNALILSLLSQSSFDVSDLILNLKSFLINEKSNRWTFNYWRRGSLSSKQSPYPDDLDSTSCIISALKLADNDLIDGEIMAHFVKSLLQVEEKAGGPYYTWLTGKIDEAWKDIDVVVNANINYCLSLAGVNLPSIQLLIDECILNKKYHSPYYYSPYSVAYFISRAYKGSYKKELIEWLNESLKTVTSSLDLAFILNSLISLGEPILEIDVKRLSEEIVLLNSVVSPFIIEKIYKESGIIDYSGCEALFLSLALNVFDYFEKSSDASSLRDDHIKNILDRVIASLREKFAFHYDLSLVLENCLLKFLSKKDGKEIILLASYFVASLGDNQREKISDSLLVKLGLISFYGWTAYTIYDDFLDEEGDVKLLSFANICLREIVILLKDIEINNSFSYCALVLDKMDKANLWEVSNTRLQLGGKDKSLSLPIYKDFVSLAEKSIGHSLGLLMVLFYLGFKETDEAFVALEDFFKNYIIARQLSDDIYDWRSDLEKGRISPVGDKILASLGLSTVNKKDLENVNLENAFQVDVSLDMLEISLSYVDKAKENIKSLDFYLNTSFLERMVSQVEYPLKLSMRKNKDIVGFKKIFT